MVGAGIAGLAAALELQSAGCDVLVVDPSDRPGGVMRTDHRKGFVVESGPSTAIVRAPMLDFLAKRGLPAAPARGAGEPQALPLPRRADGPRARLAVADRAHAAALRAREAARAHRAVSPPRQVGRRAVAEFVGRRLGREVSASLVGPVPHRRLRGRRGAARRGRGVSALGRSRAALGSLALGGLAGLLRRDAQRGLRGSYATEQGFGPFARRLAEALAEPPALGTRVAWIARDGARWHVDLTSPSGDLALSAARVVVAAPAYAAADVLRGIDGEVAAALEGIAYAPIVVAPVGVEAGRAREPIEGFGFLVPREESLGLLGCLFMSQLFPGRAPAGHELLHCMLGGVRWPEAVHLPDAALQARLAEDLSRTLGIADPPARARVRALAARRAAAGPRSPRADALAPRAARRPARARARGILRRGRVRVGLAGLGSGRGISRTAAVPFA